jgi:hypothetical protein
MLARDGALTGDEIALGRQDLRGRGDGIAVSAVVSTVGFGYLVE